MPLFYGSPAEGVAYLESVAADAADAAYAGIVYAAAVKRSKDAAGDEDDDTTA